MEKSHMPRISCLLILSGSCALTLACGDAMNQSVATGSVEKTANPLVAQYTVSSGCVGDATVEFGPDTSYGRSTSSVPLVGRHKPSTILVAGMRASTTYHMRAQITCLDSGQSISTPDTTFTTGPLPSVPFPQMTVDRPSPSKTSPENPGVELVNIFAPGAEIVQTYVTDRDGNPIWYYDVGAPNYVFTIKPLPNGHIILSDETTTASILREIDLAGNTIRDMDIPTLVAKTSAAGFNFSPTFYHHDICPLPNGHLIVLVEDAKDFVDLPGYPGTTTVIGDALIDLDQNWNPVWSWNSFDYLDVNRHLNGLPDWTHSNAVVYEPNDGNLLLSMRHQSWVLKIDYSNGRGTGNVISKLGWQGDYSLTQNGVPTTDPSLWFSFQHFPSLISQNGSQTTMTIWDNGDARVDSNNVICAGGCYSRGTVYQVDDSAMVADLLWADAPGYFSLWGGSISQLQNTNVEFDLNAPFPSSVATWASEVQEVTQTSTPQIVWKMDISSPNAYRAYRIPSLYSGVTWQN
jgi:hypothetical protein